MIHSGLVNQRRGGGFERGYPNQRNNHPRDQTIRPFVSGFDLPIIEKSQYATPEIKGASRVGVPVSVNAQTRYKDIFGKTASPDVKYYLSQLVKRVARGGGVPGPGTDGGAGPTGMISGQRPTAAPSQTAPPGQPGLPQGPYLPPDTTAQNGMPMLITESEAGSPTGEYPIADLDVEMGAEVQFESIFETPEMDSRPVHMEANRPENEPAPDPLMQNLLRIETVPIANVVTNHENDVSPVLQQIPMYGEVLTSTARRPMDLRVNTFISDSLPSPMSADTPDTPRLVQLPQVPIGSTSLNANPNFQIENSFSKTGLLMPAPTRPATPKTERLAIESSVQYAENINGVGPRLITGTKKEQKKIKEQLQKKMKEQKPEKRMPSERIAKKSKVKATTPEETRTNQAKRTVDRLLKKEKALEKKGKKLSNNLASQLFTAQKFLNLL